MTHQYNVVLLHACFWLPHQTHAHPTPPHPITPPIPAIHPSANYPTPPLPTSKLISGLRLGSCWEPTTTGDVVTARNDRRQNTPCPSIFPTTSNHITSPAYQSYFNCGRWVRITPMEFKRRLAAGAPRTALPRLGTAAADNQSLLSRPLPPSMFGPLAS